jgi:hypothetical protein
MPDSNRNYVKAQETILELLKQIQTWQPSKLTRQEINYLRGRLDLLEYLLAPKSGARIEAYTKPELRYCSVCNLSTIYIYQYLGKWWCPDHFPSGVPYPIGMHGEDFKAYQERKK